MGEVFDRCGTKTEPQPSWSKRSGFSLFKNTHVRVGLGQGCAVVKLGYVMSGEVKQGQDKMFYGCSGIHHVEVRVVFWYLH